MRYHPKSDNNIITELRSLANEISHYLVINTIDASDDLVNDADLATSALTHAITVLEQEQEQFLEWHRTVQEQDQ